jgi:hypothetical protein
MPLGLGLALSHSPVLYRPRDQWEQIYQQLVGDTPQPNRAGAETPEVLDEFVGRIEAGFQDLRRQLEEYKPDALLVIVSDRRRMFDETQAPQLHVYMGSEIWGSMRYTDLGETSSASDRAIIPCHAALAGYLAEELTWEGFDMNLSRMKFTPLGDPAGGVGHNLTDPVMKLVPNLDIPIVPIHVNGHVNPAISGHRMAPFGTALAKVLASLPERVAILASGGLSGDPRGYLAGWIDETLDHWILTRLSRGKADQLKTLWDLDSDTVRGATREVRNWIVVGGAMEEAGAKASAFDYIRFHHATVGTAFASWDPQKRPLSALVSDLEVVPTYPVARPPQAAPAPTPEPQAARAAQNR